MSKKRLEIDPEEANRNHVMDNSEDIVDQELENLEAQA